MAKKIVVAIILMTLTAGLVVVGIVVMRPEVSPDPSDIEGERIQELITETSDARWPTACRR